MEVTRSAKNSAAYRARKLAEDAAGYRAYRNGVHKAWRERNLERERARCRGFSLEKRLLYAARSRAKKLGVPCDITDSDVVIPDRCPVLGIPLARGRGAPVPGSPTLDRLVPSRGYVKGNVAVISYRANTLKNNGTPDELQRVAAWVVLGGGSAE